MKQILIDFYLDWVNNYLTVSKMADDYELTVSATVNLIEIGRKIHEQNVLDIKQGNETH